VPDFFGRGYTRTASFAYVSRVPNKLTWIVKSLRKAFSKAALELKRGGQKVFLRNIDNCLDWLEYELSLCRGKTDVEAKSLHTSKWKDRVDWETYKRYFQIDRDGKTLNDIKVDMLEIRDQFAEGICELKSSYCKVKQPTFRPNGNRPRHRPQCRKHELRSLIKMLDKFSIRCMKSRMQQILAHFRESALDIWIEQNIKRRVNSKDLVFNIGSLCQMPIGISKYTLPRQKYSNSNYQSMAKLSLPLADSSRFYDNTSYQAYSSDSESLYDFGDTRQNARSWKTHVLKEALRDQHSTNSSQEKKSSGEILRNEMVSIDSDEDVLRLNPWDSLIKLSYGLESSVLAHIPTWITGRLDKQVVIPRRASPKWKSGKSSHQQIHNKVGDAKREVCSASSSISKSHNDILDEKMAELSLGEPANPCQDNLCNDSPISCSSSGSRGSLIKVPCRIQQQELDYLLFNLLLGKGKRFAEEILYTIFIGRPLLLVASNQNVKKVIRCARAVSMLVPGTYHRSIWLWQTEPLTVQQLSVLEVVVISEGAFKASSPCVLSLCSYFFLDELKLFAPRYKKKNSNQRLTQLLNDTSCKKPGQFRRCLQTNLAQMQLSAYLYYWKFIIGITKAPMNDVKPSHRGPFLRAKHIPELVREKIFEENIGIWDKRDFAILDRWTRIIERRVEMAGTLRVSSHCFSPAKKNVKSCKMWNEGLRNRLLRQHSETPTILHLLPLRNSKLP